ncbi:21233_t:CDS:2, partial [Gigaspora margarita]
DDNEIQWAEIYQKNITKIEADETNIESQEPWMRIAEKSAQVLTNNLFDLGDDAETFLEHAKSGQIGEIFHEDDETHIDPITLNETQTQIYDY